MLMPLLGLGAAVVAIVAGLVLLTGGDEDGPNIGEVFAEPVASTGIDPFMGSLVPSLTAMPAIPAVSTDTVEQVVGLLNPPVGDLSDIDFPELDIPGLDGLPGIPDPEAVIPEDPVETAETVVATVSGAAPGLYGGTEILNTCDKEALIVGEDLETAYRELSHRLQGTEAVLLKASRGMKFERAIPWFENDFGER